MAVTPTPNSSPDSPKPRATSGNWWYLFSGVALLVFVFEWRGMDAFSLWKGRSFDPQWNGTPAPLVMSGGDPYIRALMRTISASESNSSHPYSLLYGGEHFYDFSHHPDTCVTIVSGPNAGDCSTAAGRYQMLTTTWLSKAKAYRADSSFLFWNATSFAPEDQDEVVYRWLSDSQAWGSNLSQLLHNGQIDEVLQILSPTWTSLGYGIEPNSMTSALPQIYSEMLQEELKGTAVASPAPAKPAQSSSLLDTPLREVLPRLFGAQ